MGCMLEVVERVIIVPTKGNGNEVSDADGIRFDLEPNTWAIATKPNLHQ